MEVDDHRSRRDVASPGSEDRRGMRAGSAGK